MDENSRLRSIDTQYSIIRLGKSIKSVWFPSSGAWELHKGQRLVAKGKEGLNPSYSTPEPEVDSTGLQEASGSSQGLAKRKPRLQFEEKAQTQVA